MKIEVTVHTGYAGCSHIVEWDIEDLDLSKEDFLNLSDKEKEKLFADLEQDAIFENIYASCEVIYD